MFSFVKRTCDECLNLRCGRSSTKESPIRREYSDVKSLASAEENLDSKWCGSDIGLVLAIAAAELNSQVGPQKGRLGKVGQQTSLDRHKTHITAPLRAVAQVGLFGC